MPQVKICHRTRVKQLKSFESVDLKVSTQASSDSNSTASSPCTDQPQQRIDELIQAIKAQLDNQLHDKTDVIIAHFLEFSTNCEVLNLGTPSENSDDTSRKQGNTLLKKKLIEKLTDESHESIDLARIMVYTYRWYFNEIEMFHLLLERFMISIPLCQSQSEKNVFLNNVTSKIQIKVLIYIKDWYKIHFASVEKNPAIKEAFLEMLYLISTYPHTGKWINLPIQQILSRMENISVNHEPQPKLPRNILRITYFPEIFVPLKDILDYAHHIAKHLCIFDLDNIKRVHISEFYNKAWTKPDKHIHAPNLAYIAEMSTKLSRYVSYLILMNKKESFRIMMFEYLLGLCDKLVRLRNYNSSFSVFLGLTCHAVQRLKDGIEPKLGKDYKEMLSHLRRFFSSTNNMELLRKRQEEAMLPAVPYMGIYLGDVFFLEELSDYTDPEKTIFNLKKYEMFAKKLSKVQSFKEPYGFHKVDSIYNFIRDLPAISEEKIYDLSFQIQDKS